MASPDYQKKQYQQMLSRWTLINDVSGGSETIKNATTTYLPKENAETDKSYKARHSRAVWFDAFNQTVGSIVGVSLAKKPVYGEDVPQNILDILENADGAGSHIDVMTKKFFDGAIRKGINYWLVDMPSYDETITSLADERATGRRPYLVDVDPDAIINWKTEIINGQVVLSLVVIKESVTEPLDDFEDLEITQYRVLRRGSWQIWRESGTTTQKSWSVSDEGTTSLPYIPLVSLDLDDNMPLMEAKPPLYDLAELNISHYQLYTDSRNSAHIASVPMLLMLGFQEDEAKGMVISANRAITSTNQDAKVSWLDYDGKGVELNRSLMQDLERQMSVLGLAVLAEKTVEVTATEKEIDAEQSQSKVVGWVRALKDSLENMLQIMADYTGQASGGSVEVNQDILSTPMTTEVMNAYSDMVLKGQLSVGTMWQMLLAGKRLHDDFDPDEEQQKIEDENEPAMPIPGIAESIPEGTTVAIGNAAEELKSM